MLRDLPSTDAGKYRTIRVVVLPFFFGSQLLQEKTLPSHQSIMFILKSLPLHLDCFYLFLYFSIFVSFGPKSFGHYQTKFSIEVASRQTSMLKLLSFSFRASLSFSIAKISSCFLAASLSTCKDGLKTCVQDFLFTPVGLCSA